MVSVPLRTSATILRRLSLHVLQRLPQAADFGLVARLLRQAGAEVAIGDAGRKDDGLVQRLRDRTRNHMTDGQRQHAGQHGREQHVAARRHGGGVALLLCGGGIFFDQFAQLGHAFFQRAKSGREGAEARLRRGGVGQCRRHDAGAGIEVGNDIGPHLGDGLEDGGIGGAAFQRLDTAAQQLHMLLGILRDLLHLLGILACAGQECGQHVGAQGVMGLVGLQLVLDRRAVGLDRVHRAVQCLHRNIADHAHQGHKDQVRQIGEQEFFLDG